MDKILPFDKGSYEGGNILVGPGFPYFNFPLDTIWISADWVGRG